LGEVGLGWGCLIREGWLLYLHRNWIEELLLHLEIPYSDVEKVEDLALKRRRLLPGKERMLVLFLA
jgi:hypothetical protein